MADDHRYSDERVLPTGADREQPLEKTWITIGEAAAKVFAELERKIAAREDKAKEAAE